MCSEAQKWVTTETQGHQEIIVIKPFKQTHVDYEHCFIFREVIDKYVLPNFMPMVIVDFSEVDYLNSSGLGLLLSLGKELKAEDGRLVLIQNKCVENLLGLTRLTGIFTTAQTKEEALDLLALPEPAS